MLCDRNRMSSRWFSVGDVLRIVIVCVILGYTVKMVGQTNVSETPLQKHIKPTFLAAPKRAVKHMYCASVAIKAHNALLKAMAQRVVDSINKDKPKWEYLVFIGDAYARGKYPFLAPNQRMALTCYKVAESCPSSTVAASAASRMREIVLNPVELADQTGAQMSTEHGNYACEMAARYISHNKPQRDRVSLQTKPRPAPPLRHIRADIQPEQTRNTEADRVVDPNTRRYRNLGGGSQNTHDHGVVTATKTKIQQLQQEHAGYVFRDHSAVVDEAVQLCNSVVEDPDSSGISKDTLHDAFEVATSLTSDEYSDTGLTQIQILDLALKKIQSLDPQVSKGVEETLCKRMATGIEDGRTVCATGKIARIVSVFEGVEENSQKAVPIAYVEREIAQMAAKVRDDFLERVGPVGKKAYESAQSVPEYGTSMAAILREKVTEEYVHKLNMSPAIIGPLIELYSGSF